MKITVDMVDAAETITKALMELDPQTRFWGEMLKKKFIDMVGKDTYLVCLQLLDARMGDS